MVQNRDEIRALIEELSSLSAPGEMPRRIAVCREALALVDRDDRPELWARLQGELGSSLQQNPQEDRAQNIEEAISRHEQALGVYTREDFPLQWALTQNNLAYAYSQRIRGDRAQNIEEAISHYEQALGVYTRENFPLQWALTQNNLANAYSERIRGDRAQNIEEAISRYELALEVRTRQDFPVEWAKTHNNLAYAYSQRIRGDRAQNIEEAISRHEQALGVYTREDFPLQWALTQNNLAYAYSQRIRGDRAQNIEEAISHYEQALGVYTRENFPLQWALTQNNLANAYSERIRGDRAQNIEEAISRYELALEVRTSDTLPQDCRDTAYTLGSLLYGEGRFAEARRALTTAHEAVEVLRGELQREGAKQRLAEENADLYARLVHCCLVEGDEEAAFEYAVAGKGRAFVDMLATSRFDLSAAAADDPQLGEDLRRAREFRQQIDNLLSRLFGEGGTSPEEDGQERGSIRSQMQAELRSLQEREAAHWEEMSFRYPALTATQQAPTLSFGEARRLSGELGATLVEYYQHAGGWCAFVVTPGGVRYVPLPGVDEDLVDTMRTWPQLIESPYRFSDVSYDLLRSLHRAVIAPLGDYLPRGGAVVLAPFSGLHLLPLNAALDPATGRYAADDHLLGLTPNLAALRVAVDQQSGEDDSSAEEEAYERLLGVAYPGSPDSDHYLHNVVSEAEAVASHFALATPLHKEAATPDAVLSHARGHDVVHFGCHGTFDAGAPEQSGLMLSGGWLTVQRVITELHLQQTRLATIGACLSGRVRLREGEEHVGLVQAIMSAGAGTVVASLWAVDDDATRELFEAFYAGIKAGKSPAAALAEATRAVREQGWEHPYYWAAFQPMGLAHEGHRHGASIGGDSTPHG